MSQAQHEPSMSSISFNGNIGDMEKKSSSPVDSPGDIEKGRQGPKVLADPTDWNGVNDPSNPLNWPAWKRTFQVVPPALISFSCSLGSSIYSPAFRNIQHDFHVGSTVALLPLSLYVLALGFGPLLAAPISETYGRRFVYLVSTPIGTLFTLGAGLSNNIWTLCILRFFAGLTFSPSLAIGAGSIADVYKVEHLAAPASLYTLSPFLGPALGPVLGSFVTVRKSWRWTQWTIIFFAIFSMIATLFAKETYKKTLIQRRNKKLGLLPPPTPFASPSAKIRFLLTVTLTRPLRMLFTEPIVVCLSLYVAFNFSVLFSFFAAFPYVFESAYGFDVEQCGLVFLAIGVGCMLAVPTVLTCDRFLYRPQARISHEEGRKGVVPPEYRLYPAMMGSFGLPIGLFWFAWTARRDISWASPVVGAVPFAWGNLSIFIASATYLLDTYRAMNGASAMAANGFLRYALGAAFPLFTLQMYERLGIHWATSLLGFITVLLMPIPWVLFKFGKSIRARSQYDTLKA